MTRYSLGATLILAIGLAAAGAVPSHAFIGYGIEAGTPLYDALAQGYRPYRYFTPHQYDTVPPPTNRQRRVRR